MNKYLQVMEAMRYLAVCCDGAKERDGAGFNAQDSQIGKNLAADSLTIGWSQAQMEVAVKMLQKYRGQLLDACLPLPSIKEVVR